MPNTSSGARFSLRFVALILALVAAIASGCMADRDTRESGVEPPPDEAGDEATLRGDLDDPDIREQIKGAVGVGESHPGAALYAQNCAACHDNATLRAPARNLLELLTPTSVLASLESGVMKQQGALLSAQERTDVVEYLVGSKPAFLPVHSCKRAGSWFDWRQPPPARGWGIDYNNRRHIPSSVAKLDGDDLPSLKVRWVFDYPGATRARSHPSIAGGALFVGSQNGSVYALDQATGCVRWVYEAGAEVRTGITIDFDAASASAVGYFADLLARVHAVDLTTGTRLWRTAADDHPNATGTAQPVVFEGRVYQPVSSLEVVPAADPAYACCTFRGSIATLDAATGALLRKTYTITQAPGEVARNDVGTPVMAPSGAPVWNTPALDEKRRRLYFGTGENYSSPADGNSDAIMAMDIDSGELAWVTQTTSRDAWNLACMPFIENQTNCPIERGPDVDFGAPPILVSEGGRDILVAGQKSGEVFGIAPDDGRLLWRRKVGRGGNQGGIHFGMSAQGATVFVPVSDYTDASLSAADARPGLYALDAFTGELKWSHPAPDVCGDKADCDPGISAAISAIDGAVLAGHMDGWLRAYDPTDGALVWALDTDREFQSISGNPARGGSFGGATAPMAYNGMLYVNSGYGLYFHRPGNVLIALGPAGD